MMDEYPEAEIVDGVCQRCGFKIARRWAKRHPKTCNKIPPPYALWEEFQEFSISELEQIYDVSVTTIYKWLDGYAGRKERVKVSKKHHSRHLIENNQKMRREKQLKKKSDLCKVCGINLIRVSGVPEGKDLISFIYPFTLNEIDRGTRMCKECEEKQEYEYQ